MPISSLSVIMDLVRTFGPWYNFARLFGYYPVYGLRLDYARWEAVTRIGATLILSLGNIGLHSLIWWTLPVHSNYFNTTIGSRVEVTFNVVDSAVPVITILMNLILFGRAKQLFGTLQEADQLLEEIHIRVEYGQQRLYSLVVLFLVLAMQLLTPAIIPIALSDSQYFKDLLPITIYMTYRQLSNLSFLGSIMMILMAVFIRFKSINVCLFANFLRKPGNTVGISPVDGETSVGRDTDPVVLINVLSRIHQILCEAVEQMNFVFSFQVRNSTRFYNISWKDTN